jgi:type IV pilus assembly protein PilB
MLKQVSNHICVTDDKMAIEEIPNRPRVRPHRRFGESLVSKGLLKTSELDKALDEQRVSGGRLGEVLLRTRAINETEMTNALAEHLSIPVFSLADFNDIDIETARMLPETIAKRFELVVIGNENGRVVVAMADPLNVVARDIVEQKLLQPIKVLLSAPQKITAAIELIYHGSDVEEQRLRDLVELEADPHPSESDLLIEKIARVDANEADITETDMGAEAASKAPVIRFVDLLLSQAVKSRASDIHIEPQDKSMAVRMRIDGILTEMVPPSRKMQAAVIARVKILSQMNIAERRLPQDGRFKIKAPGRDIDVRVSSIPVIYGEKIVMRILDSKAVDHDISRLGFDDEMLSRFKSVLSLPHGIVIVTGPTGSGKSTTLYSALNYLKDPAKNITTVEDPVEYRLDGINQIQIKPDIDLDFALSLRAILRQDPDIVLIGEIRDKETMEIAMKASLTGHLVLSTFHTNDAPSAISRLRYMGLEPYLLSSTINLIVAQRLVRRICPNCKTTYDASPELIARFGMAPKRFENAVFYHGAGCQACIGTGYLGRLPIFEFLVMDADIRRKIVAGGTEAEIRVMSREKGYGGLLDSGVNRMLDGLTTAEEVLRVTFADTLNQ